MNRIIIIPGRSYLCGCDCQPGQRLCRTHGLRRAVDLTFTLMVGGPNADSWRVSIESEAARAWCATHSSGCYDSFIPHKSIGAVVERAAAAGLCVRCE